MNPKMAASKLVTTKTFLKNTQKHTAYEDPVSDEANQLFSQLQQELPQIYASAEGQKLVQKYSMLGKTVTAEGPFLDMVKIVWRMVKTMGGSPLYRLSLFLIGIGTLIDTVRSSPFGANCHTWEERVEKWLGTQLTIGGKGCTGEGEGPVISRVQRFFSTPYLHDFD